MGEHWELTSNFYAITQLDNEIAAKELNSYEWLEIIRKLLEYCGKFLRAAFENNREYSQYNKSLRKYIFKFLLPESVFEKRFPCPGLVREIECHPFLLDFDTPCIFAKRLEREEMGEVSFETWLLMLLEGKLLFVELAICNQLKKKKEPHGYDEVVISAAFFMDTTNGNSQELFASKLLPYLDFKLARSIIYNTLDILEFDKLRRKKEADEFQRAYDFRKMILARIYFPA